MKISDYKKEAISDAKSRKERIFRLVKKSDVNALRQKKTVFDYLYNRSDDKVLRSISEFDDIIHVVGHFSDQIPDFYKLSHSFTENHFRSLEKTLKYLKPTDDEIDLDNEIIIEKSDRHTNTISSSLRNLLSITNVEILTENFTAVFLPSAIEIYDSLIALLNDVSDPDEDRDNIYEHFAIIVPSLDTLKEGFFSTE